MEGQRVRGRGKRGWEPSNDHSPLQSQLLLSSTLGANPPNQDDRNPREKR